MPVERGHPLLRRLIGGRHVRGMRGGGLGEDTLALERAKHRAVPGQRVLCLPGVGLHVGRGLVELLYLAHRGQRGRPAPAPGEGIAQACHLARDLGQLPGELTVGHACRGDRARVGAGQQALYLLPGVPGGARLLEAGGGTDRERAVPDLTAAVHIDQPLRPGVGLLLLRRPVLPVPGIDGDVVPAALDDDRRRVMAGGGQADVGLLGRVVPPAEIVILVAVSLCACRRSPEYWPNPVDDLPITWVSCCASGHAPAAPEAVACPCQALITPCSSPASALIWLATSRSTSRWTMRSFPDTAGSCQFAGGV